MKPNLLTFACSPFRGRAVRCRAAAFLGGLVVALTLPGTGAKAQVLSISNSVLLSWPESTEEQIVVGSDSLASNAVWTPWPEPIFKRCGQLCMAVPATARQQFFKTVPGAQFSDDFSEPTQPFATRNPWVPYFFNTDDAARFSFTVTNGALRLRTLAGPVDGRVSLAPPGPLITFRDLTVSVDILSFTSTASPRFAICARAWLDDPFPGNSNTYLGGVRVNPAGVQIWDGSLPHPGPSFTYDPAATYRLQFSAVGKDLSLRLVNLATRQTLEQRLNDVTFTQGYAMLWVEAVPGGSYDVTVDNFFVTGTKP